MNVIEIRRGDTIQLNLNITNNGKPFVPENEKIVFSVGRYGKILFSIEAINNVIKIPYEDTSDLEIGKYKFDIRIYNSEKTLVATPVVGEFIVSEVVNDELL